MEIIKGKYSEAVIFTDDTEQYAKAQLQLICDNEVAKNSIIRVMPDVHPGKVGTIGLTMTISDRIMPNLMGIDIGCGMLCAKIKGKNIELQKLDKVIRERVPSGFDIREDIHAKAVDFDFDRLHCIKAVGVYRALLSLGTLGGGNHFIELDRDSAGDYFIVIHSGSRHFGKEVTEYYMEEGMRLIKGRGEHVPYELCYLTGELMEDYLFDVKIVQEFASLNRRIILDEILKGMKWKAEEIVESVHNYVDEMACSGLQKNVYTDEISSSGLQKNEYTDEISSLGLQVDKTIVADADINGALAKQTIDGVVSDLNSEVKSATRILRKGAISAMKGQQVIIPVNMRDGVILGVGKGNADWNYSASHGSGRVMKREDVKNSHTVSEFKKEMKGIYCTCIGKETLDEAPFAYRSIDAIKDKLKDTVDVTDILKPVFNWKGTTNL